MKNIFTHQNHYTEDEHREQYDSPHGRVQVFDLVSYTFFGLI